MMDGPSIDISSKPHKAKGMERKKKRKYFSFISFSFLRFPWFLLFEKKHSEKVYNCDKILNNYLVMAQKKK
jgi:hypothetical protein